MQPPPPRTVTVNKHAKQKLWSPLYDEYDEYDEYICRAVREDHLRLGCDKLREGNYI